MAALLLEGEERERDGFGEFAWMRPSNPVTHDSTISTTITTTINTTTTTTIISLLNLMSRSTTEDHILKHSCQHLYYFEKALVEVTQALKYVLVVLGADYQHFYIIHRRNTFENWANHLCNL
ncbi:hypothetical protein E2C01_072277 [Portunus trituberculatus]|uniref:Uncharacterized protein n=1 Tax=Portunus trituberculatus TaxID=210409 RepID=A0A5B7HZG0_PORTR|nr:hypothetical protein [Portunus trituberculatus]